MAVQDTIAAGGQALWSAVDAWFDAFTIPADDALTAAVTASDAAGLPAIQVAANQGKLLHLMARMLGAKRILEIGTLGGYSTIWLARALAPGGSLVSLEVDGKHADVARSNVARAGLADVVTIRLGTALDTLPMLADEGGAPFDLVFIDADKQNIPQYFDWAIRLSRPGSLIVVDNVVRKGAVIDPDTTDTNVQGVQRFAAQLAGERRVSATTIQTVGTKGHDGLTFALVLPPDAT